MARPISAQPRKSAGVLSAQPRAARPAAKTRLLAISTGRPPKRSIARPAAGPTAAATINATEKAANTVETPMPSVRAIGAASMAGR